MQVIIENVIRIRSNDIGNFEVVTQDAHEGHIEHTIYVPVEFTVIIQPDHSVFVEM